MTMLGSDWLARVFSRRWNHERPSMNCERLAIGDWRLAISDHLSVIGGAVTVDAAAQAVVGIELTPGECRVPSCTSTDSRPGVGGVERRVRPCIAVAAVGGINCESSDRGLSLTYADLVVGLAVVSKEIALSVSGISDDLACVPPPSHQRGLSLNRCCELANAGLSVRGNQLVFGISGIAVLTQPGYVRT